MFELGDAYKIESRGSLIERFLEALDDVSIIGVQKPPR